MIWHLLWLYPLIGLGLGVYYAPKYKKYKVAGGLGWMIPLMLLGWPLALRPTRSDIIANREAFETHEEWKTEQLLERVRQERLAPDPRLAEFDILLGIEPEPVWVSADRLPMIVQQGYPMGERAVLNYEPEVKYNAKPDEVCPSTVAEYQRNQRLAKYRAAVLDRQLFSAGGHITDSAGNMYTPRPPTITELNKGVDIRAKVE